MPTDWCFANWCGSGQTRAARFGLVRGWRVLVNSNCLKSIAQLSMVRDLIDVAEPQRVLAVCVGPEMER